VGSARLGRFVWPGMFVAGLALAAAVWATWPEPQTRIVRLPYGESQPKAPTLVAAKPATQRPSRSVSVFPATPEAPRTPAPFGQPEAEEPGRVLAAVEPSPTTEDFDPTDGPAPVPSDFELSGDYEQEPPEELGAEPLPGADLTGADLTPEQPAGG
jgi:hypothetical protein